MAKGKDTIAAFREQLARDAAEREQGRARGQAQMAAILKKHPDIDDARIHAMIEALRTGRAATIEEAYRITAG